MKLLNAFALMFLFLSKLQTLIYITAIKVKLRLNFYISIKFPEYCTLLQLYTLLQRFTLLKALSLKEICFSLLEVYNDHQRYFVRYL